MQEAFFSDTRENVYTLSELTREIKSLLEGQYASLWVSGEISNFHAHASGHFYFTLKDANAQISAVMFRGANRLLRFRPENGLEVLANGRISVYEPRGQYQIVLDFLEPKGLGALQLAFDQLRKKLEGEGLFAEARKRPLPFCPKTIGIVTSPGGAAVRDMIHILRRRYPAAHILIYPVLVQGESAPQEIAEGIACMNIHAEAEVLIVGRGGGSLEDLWAFNTEIVARAIVSSKIPVISAVGHETDFTISDFVADLRAPTPSAAAELVVPVLEELKETLRLQGRRLRMQMRRTLAEKAENLRFWTHQLKHPKKRLEELSMRLDELVLRLEKNAAQRLQDRRRELGHLIEKLEALSPLAILSRGYSLARKINRDGSEGPVLRDAAQVREEDWISLRLSQGSLQAQVKSRKSP